ncbi:MULTISPECIES: hypothetical protein [unclassified Paenibacillus]|uniref:hypothetical protein n=1 Tax=unclassified Paenibacillus TaxID=185978 RepID=UPI002405D759|nr:MULTISPECIES: hypothetical protein [unclassified Paenibacillus]MDF9844250.1 hypothetical protein [Paenibacillus sp. PastF-2]MDF9850855.1 hypothetical protein [Paenibacillus sp. PastM-2]MDF9857382.1 hypothetical protein [Paenibacillus sp. PastF-1]MDH6482650.1 hypothetical protein [Paenibacillus sp. PastH-2]MDH6510120.1 hypothetical protein [Paenibacillus sp. PastM-3]
MDKFYIVRMPAKENEKPILLGTLSSGKKRRRYLYKPFNLDKYKYPRSSKPFVKKSPPHLLTSRTYDAGRPDISEILSSMNLDSYDPWKMVEIKEGRVMTDSLCYLTESGLEKYGLKELKLQYKELTNKRRKSFGKI